MFELYYHIPWPQSQEWMDMKDPVEDGLVVGDDDGGCFVAKNFYDYIKETE